MLSVRRSAGGRAIFRCRCLATGSARRPITGAGRGWGAEFLATLADPPAEAVAILGASLYGPWIIETDDALAHWGAVLALAGLERIEGVI